MKGTDEGRKEQRREGGKTRGKRKTKKVRTFYNLAKLLKRVFYKLISTK